MLTCLMDFRKTSTQCCVRITMYVHLCIGSFNLLFGTAITSSNDTPETKNVTDSGMIRPKCIGKTVAIQYAGSSVAADMKKLMKTLPPKSDMFIDMP